MHCFHRVRNGLGSTLIAYWQPTGLSSRTGRAMVVIPAGERAVLYVTRLYSSVRRKTEKNKGIV